MHQSEKKHRKLNSCTTKLGWLSISSTTAILHISCERGNISLMDCDIFSSLCRVFIAHWDCLPLHFYPFDPALPLWKILLPCNLILQEGLRQHTCNWEREAENACNPLHQGCNLPDAVVQSNAVEKVDYKACRQACIVFPSMNCKQLEHEHVRERYLLESNDIFAIAPPVFKFLRSDKLLDWQVQGRRL